jgi:hypothetical protein
MKYDLAMNPEELKEIMARYDKMLTDCILSSDLKPMRLFREDSEFAVLNKRIEKANKHLMKACKLFEDTKTSIRTKYDNAMMQYLISVGCLLDPNDLTWKIILDGYEQTVNRLSIKHFYRDLKSGMANITIGRSSQSYNFMIVDGIIRFETDNCMY